MKKIVILHIGYVDGNKASGVNVAIPKMVHAQHKYANTMLLNLSREYTDEFSVSYSQYARIRDLPSPFNCPNIVIFHELYREPFIRLSHECKCTNIPYVIIPHGGLTHRAQKIKAYKKIPANLFVFHNFFRNAALIQYLSDVEHNTSIIKEKTFVCGNGVIVSNKEHKFNKGLGLRILFIGRYDIYFKGLDILLDAVNLIKEDMRKKNISLTLFGTGKPKEEETLRKYIQQNKLAEIVKLNGPIYGDDKISQYQSFDCFIQTSRSEGQPLGVMEALSYGMPVIVTPGTSFSELVERNKMGIACEFNATSISKAILHAAEERDTFKTMSKNAIDFMRNNYDEDVIAQKAIYKYSLLKRT